MPDKPLVEEVEETWRHPTFFSEGDPESPKNVLGASRITNMMVPYPSYSHGIIHLKLASTDIGNCPAYISGVCYKHDLQKGNVEQLLS